MLRACVCAALALGIAATEHKQLHKILLVLTVARRDRFYLTRRYERFFGGVADSAEVS